MFGFYLSIAIDDVIVTSFFSFARPQKPYLSGDRPNFPVSDRLDFKLKKFLLRLFFVSHKLFHKSSQSEFGQASFPSIFGPSLSTEGSLLGLND